MNEGGHKRWKEGKRNGREGVRKGGEGQEGMSEVRRMRMRDGPFCIRQHLSYEDNVRSRGIATNGASRG